MIEEIIFTKEECKWILNSCGEFIRSGVTNDGETIEITDYRTCYEYSFINNIGISNLLLHKLKKFNVVSLPDILTVIRYDTGEYFDSHIDSGIGHEYRYKSVSIQLSEPTSYKGGTLILSAPNERNEMESIASSTELGNMIMFDSYLRHEVTPTISGTRYVLVFWLRADDIIST